MATLNKYLAVYQNGGRISEGDDSNPIKPSDYLLIPTEGETDSAIISLSAVALSGYATNGNTTFTLDGTTSLNRWELSLVSDMSSASWGNSVTITNQITSTSAQTFYARARALGPLVDERTESGDTIEDDVSVHIIVATKIIKAR